MSLSLPSLRTWRSTIYATSSRDPRALAVESPASINNRLSQQQQHYESSVTELRRRLARKASTFSLRSKSRHSQRQLRDQLVKEEEESDTASVETVKQEEVKVQQVRSHSIGVALELPAPSPALPDSGVLPAFEKSQLFRTATQARRKDHTGVSMSSESSPPPVPLAKLQTITTEACDLALASASSYVHASTAEWSKTIINSVLQSLVKETTSDSQPQPQYKFLVNSTIIQHASGVDGGRRGMHAASGAYWNNEKDGMWSFKYEAAEGKGLDVVVGVIWVWIG